MHLQPFTPSGGRSPVHWLHLWVLLLLVPACFALVTMPRTLAAVAVTLTFGLPLTIRLALRVHDARELPAQVPDAVRFAAGASVTGLGLGGLFAFSAALAWATLAAYAVTVGLVSACRGTPSGARPEATVAPSSMVATHDLVRRMTDAELCHAWRRSFVALQQARDLHLRALIVQTRQLLLDEVEARHPAGLQAWLGSGALAAGGPDRFIGPNAGGSGHPEAA